MNNEEKIKQAAEILSKAKNIVGFTGAGTSAESSALRLLGAYIC